MSNATKMRTRLRYPLLLVVIVVLVSLFWSLRLAQKKAESLIRSKVDARGWGIHIDTPKVSLTGNARIDQICVSLKDDDHNDVCVHELSLQLQPLALIRKQVHIQNMQAASIRVDSTTERLRELRTATTDDDENADDDTDTSRTLPVLKRAAIDTLQMRLTHEDKTIDLHFEDLHVRSASNDTTLQTHGYLHAFESENERLQEGLQPALNQRFTIDARGDLEEGLHDVALAFDERVDLRIALSTPIDIALEGLAFEAPYTVRADGPDLRVERYDLRLNADTIRADVGAWTRDLSVFYLSSLSAESPHLSITRDALSLLIQKALRSEESDTPDADQASEDTQPSDPADESNPPSVTTAHSPVGALVKDFAKERQWYEVLPRAMQFREARITLVGEDNAQNVQLHDLNLDYGVRALHQQMDVEWDGALATSTAESGEFDGRLEWNYTRKIGRLFWNINNFDLSALTALSRRIAPDALQGTFESEGRLRIDKKQQFTGAHQTEVRDLKIDHSRLENPLEIDSFRVAGDVDYHSIRAAQTADEDTDLAPSFVLKEQKLRLGEARATLQIELVDFTPFETPRTDTVYIDFDVPVQPAMTVFESIPQSVRGPLVGTKMDGEWGLRVGFDIERAGETDEGRALWNIRAPRVYHVHDKNLKLLSLPEAVDVRRLNDAMEFVFRGPDDRFMRTIDIPSPSAADALRERAKHPEDQPTAADPEDTALAPRSRDGEHVWTPLQEMSFYLLATQLYREDGSFFKNTGINWLQIRRVLSDALTHHRVQRGASTITMQTVKNLFLTHEKSAERKLQELFLTYWMTRTVPKDRIFEVYMNVIELCPDCNGVEEASRFHFDRPSKDLEIREAVWLSAISPNPTTRGGVQPKKAVGFDECPRCDQILRGLHARGWINDAEFDAGTVAPIEAPTTDPDALSPDGWFFAFEGERDGLEDDFPLSPTDDTLAPDQETPDVSGTEAPEDADAFERLSVEARLQEWIDTQRPVRDAR